MDGGEFNKASLTNGSDTLQSPRQCLAQTKKRQDSDNDDNQADHVHDSVHKVPLHWKLRKVQGPNPVPESIPTHRDSIESLRDRAVGMPANIRTGQQKSRLGGPRTSVAVTGRPQRSSPASALTRHRTVSHRRACEWWLWSTSSLRTAFHAHSTVN